MMKLQNTAFYRFGKDLVNHFIRDDVSGLSAQLAYYFLLSLFPFFIFAFTLLGYLPISTHDVLVVLEKIIPGKVTSSLETTLHQFLNTKRGWLLFFALIGTLATASGGINALIYALNKAYDVAQERSWWLTRILSVLFTIGMVIAILLTLIFPVFGKMIEVFIIQDFGPSPSILFLWSLLRWTISLLFLIILFVLLYYFAPNRKVPLRHVLVGAIFAAGGWLLVSWGFSFYVNNFANYSLTYGSLGGVIVLMTWFYLSAMIIILGGQVNALLEKGRAN